MTLKPARRSWRIAVPWVDPVRCLCMCFGRMATPRCPPRCPKLVVLFRAPSSQADGLAGTSCRRARGRCPASHAESRPFGSDPSRLRQRGYLRAALAMPCSTATPIYMHRHGASKSRQHPSSRTCWRHSWNETGVSGRQEPPMLPDDHPVCEQATRPPAAYGTSTVRPIQLMAAALEDRLNAPMASDVDDESVPAHMLRLRSSPTWVT